MIRSLITLWAVIAVGLAQPALAETAPRAGEYEPTVGQEGKDVVWVPTPDALVEHMLKMAKVTSRDFVMDLGSGDGRIAIAAAKKFGARAMGIEYNPDMVRLSKRNAKEAGVADKVNFVQADLFETDLSKADVITMYLLPRINLELRPKLLQLKPGTRIVSHAFDMGEWKSDEDAVIEGRDAYLWIVPARADGDWRLSYPDSANSTPVDLALTQNYQIIWGHARRGDERVEVVSPWLSGENIRFTLRSPEGHGQAYTGQVRGNRMEGTYQGADGKQYKWTATRLN